MFCTWVDNILLSNWIYLAEEQEMGMLVTCGSFLIKMKKCG